MDSGVTPTHSKKPALVIIVLVLLLLGLVYVYGQNKSKVQNSNTGWTNYTASKYGFKFSYPKDWGAATINKVPGTTGYSLLITFPQKRQQSKTTTIVLKADSDNLTHKACDAITNECTADPGFTSKNITERLDNKKGLVEYGKNYYAILASQPQTHLSQQLMFAEIVDLKQSNISAVQANYSLSGYDVSCQNDKLSDSNTPGCISEETYTNVRKTLDSFTSVK